MSWNRRCPASPFLSKCGHFLASAGVSGHSANRLSAKPGQGRFYVLWWQAVWRALPSNWRKGSFLNPFCHLVIKAVRVDSPPCQIGTQSLAELLTKYRMKAGLNRENLAAKLGVSLGTLKNWERGWTRPNRRCWKAIHSLIYRTNSTIRRSEVQGVTNHRALPFYQKMPPSPLAKR